MKIFLFLCLSIFMTTSVAQDRYPFKNSEQSARFSELTKELRCLVCQNQDLASSNALLANDLRQQVYDMVLADKTNAEIIDYMVARYGDFVLFKPLVNRVTLFIWVLPFALLVLGVIIFLGVVKKHNKRVMP